MDELYLKVKKWVNGLLYVTHESLQKKFKVGYNEADVFIRKLIEDKLIESTPIEGIRYRTISKRELKKMRS